MKKRALISVSNKNNLLFFCQELVKLNFEIISTGGTKKFLDDNKIPNLSISHITNFPEILGGRVKTLHPNVHAGILAERENKEHQEQVTKFNLSYIDLVVVNLYPFKDTILKPNVSLEEAIENIDIGGPTMLRSAAKNYKDVTAVCNVDDYTLIIDELKTNGNTSLATRKKMAIKVFEHTANYDSIIVDYLKQTETDHTFFAQQLPLSFEKVYDLRYGENPHQKASLYKQYNVSDASLINAKILQGKELSYNNIQDADIALNIINEFKKSDHICVAIKHCNPCGVSIGKNITEAWKKTLDADPISIFGGIVAFNHQVEEELALLMKDIFLEIIIAPKFSNAALKVLAVKKNLRLIEMNIYRTKNHNLQIKSIYGGVLIQEKDARIFDINMVKSVTEKFPTQQEIKDLDFAWKIVKHIKSNAIVLASNEITIGIGVGQTSRIGATKIALEQMKEKNISLLNPVLASDAFLPFDDIVHLANNYGIKSIIQPGGSVRDIDSITACNELGLSMLFTGIRHFTH